MKRLILIVALAMAAAAPAHAQNLTLGEPTYGGSGCPQGTATATVGDNGSTLTIVYDQYVAETATGRMLDRKSCDLAIPLQVPSGFSVSILGIDYLGHNQLPAGATATFQVEYFFTGDTGIVFTRDFTGPLTEDYSIHNDVGMAVWSACGQDVVLRTNSSIVVTAPEGQQATSSVGRQDIHAALVFLLSWQPC